MLKDDGLMGASRSRNSRTSGDRCENWSGGLADDEVELQGQTMLCAAVAGWAGWTDVWRCGRLYVQKGAHAFLLFAA